MSDHPVDLRAGPEFDQIRSLLLGWRSPDASIALPPGDDCSHIRGGDLLLSVDLSVEEVHFRREWLSPTEIGRRACAAALSDLAAMGGEVLGVLLSIAAAEGDVPRVLHEVGEGVRSGVREFGGELLGGDISRSPGPLMVDIVAVGRASDPWTRFGANPGDQIWVTGFLGSSRMALQCLREGRTVPDAARTAFANPTPRIREALWIRERIDVRAAIDLSDGLAGDSGQIAAASGLRIVLERDRLPIHPELSDGREPSESATRAALIGGEDYELLIAAPLGAVEPFVAEFRDRFGLPLTRVGIVAEGRAVEIRDHEGSVPTPVDELSFTHFTDAHMRSGKDST